MYPRLKKFIVTEDFLSVRCFVWCYLVRRTFQIDGDVDSGAVLQCVFGSLCDRRSACTSLQRGDRLFQRPLWTGVLWINKHFAMLTLEISLMFSLFLQKNQQYVEWSFSGLLIKLVNKSEYLSKESFYSNWIFYPSSSGDERGWHAEGRCHWQDLYRPIDGALSI